MISVAEDQSARGLAGWLEALDQHRSGRAAPAARRAVAHKARLSPGTLENLARGRLKRGLDLIRDRLMAVAISELESEAARVEHELTVLRASHRRVDQEQIVEAAASLEALRRALKPN